MKKTYQPIVIETCDLIIGSLIETKFFEENDITSLDYANKVLCDSLTQKFIEGKLDNEGIFNEDEFLFILQKIIAESVVESLKEKGLLFTYGEDESNEGIFLTEKGEKMAEILSNKNKK